MLLAQSKSSSSSSSKSTFDEELLSLVLLLQRWGALRLYGFLRNHILSRGQSIVWIKIKFTVF
ncbi:Pentatricopeptide repeat-containing protein [Frankliniella fusca]|uniref:Pentatricopeptide repeat-containing protein n=1 Tax=Frankliniella fusca TaxID=407009 RepID=A0AAE1HMX0_9NEOP|nr:Pentatricopeptide repeat-containing protein [Frankliniella fusca]